MKKKRKGKGGKTVLRFEPTITALSRCSCDHLATGK